LELVQASAGGDRKAFHSLVDRYAPELTRLARSLSRTRSDAEDVVQETFIGAYRSAARFDGRASVRTWLTRILVRQAAKAWNKNRRQRETQRLDGVEGSDGAWQRPDGSSGLAGSTSSVDRRIDLQQIIATLGEDHRQVIVMREIDGLSYAEISDALGVPQGTVESRLHRARAELRVKLAGYMS
jgi:RNA polymerase sigma-70 factor (ECF subfamily)